ncbi:Histidyl-tRNA synthetase [hydrothermal vent metagenome]|uniref:histidine--tRNA ligase n=1 Tax=hydrothermal vent metagenome TaxID=652676 RepID=A0A3B1DRS3_9ZZZZ
MKDIMDDDSKLFTYFIDNCSSIVKKYGFNYLETPILEETKLFKRSVGESSDIVNKEMYRFEDKGNNDVCLRPEGTAGVVRMLIQNKIDRAGGSHKYYYHGPMFRYERPQKGRLREFHQFGCESFGEDSVYEDANIILMISTILNFFNIEYELQLNSLGCQQCMPIYKNNLVKHIEALHLCEDCNRRKLTNPIRVLDCKNEKCLSALNSSHVPYITDCLCEGCNTDFVKLKSILNDNNVEYKVSPTLVRGLDYYTKTAFEFISNKIGAQNSIAGGGRYDKLVEYLGGRPTLAIGFALGIERLLDLIKLQKNKEDILYIGAMSEEAIDVVFTKVAKKREKLKVITDYRVRSFEKHLNNAQKKGATIVALIGKNELDKNTIWTKDLEKQEEKTINMDKF